MAYIVLDMEWNQNGIHQKCPVNKRGQMLKDEIIQIGAVKLDDALRFVDTFKIGVRLPGHRTLNRHVAKVVQINQQEVDLGLDFPEAMKRFRNWCGPRPVFLIWGFDDIPVLKQNLAYYGLSDRWTAQWYNAQMIYAWQFLEQRQQVSLMGAAQALEVATELPLHDAFNDALYTAKICQKLDIAAGMEAYEGYIKPAPKKSAPRKRRRRLRQKKAPTALQETQEVSAEG